MKHLRELVRLVDSSLGCLDIRKSSEAYKSWPESNKEFVRYPKGVEGGLINSNQVTNAPFVDHGAHS